MFFAFTFFLYPETGKSKNFYIKKKQGGKEITPTRGAQKTNPQKNKPLSTHLHQEHSSVVLLGSLYEAHHSFRR